MAAVLQPAPQQHWQPPDYLQVFARRVERLRRIRANPAVLPALRVYYRDHVADFIHDWAMTQEPRNSGRGIPTEIPLQLWPRQRELVDWIVDRWQSGENGAVVKARDSGVSWLTIAIGVALCLFHPGTVVGYASRKVELVDGTPKSLFAKARFLLSRLPREFLGGLDLERHSASMRIAFPNGSAMTGEGGTQVGRGDRTALYFVDEAAFLEDEAAADAALSQTTRCRIDVSTPHGRVGAFADKFFGGKIPTFIFAWAHDPRKDAAWRARQEATLDPITLAQEIDCDFYASVEGVLIPLQWAQAAVGAHTKLGITPSGIRRASLDVADEGSNRCCLSARHGVLLTHLHSWSGAGSDLFASTTKAFGLLDDWGLRDMLFDSDGLGCGVSGIARALNEARQAATRPEITVDAYRGSAAPADPEGAFAPGSERTNADLFSNSKAQSWFLLRRRFETTLQAVTQGRTVDPDEVISLPPDLPELPELLVELATPTYHLNQAGKICVDKAPDGARSPDRADSVCMNFGAPMSSVAIWLKLGAQE